MEERRLPEPIAIIETNVGSISMKLAAAERCNRDGKETIGTGGNNAVGSRHRRFA